MADIQHPNVGEERIEEGKPKRSIKSILVSRQTWKIVLGVFSFGYKIFKFVAKETDLF